MYIPETLRQRSEYALDALMNSLPGLSAGVIATTDGFEVATREREGADVAKLSAMASSLSALGTMICQESEMGQYQNVTIETDAGYILILDIDHPHHPMIINLVVKKNEMLGRVLYLAKRTVDALITLD